MASNPTPARADDAASPPSRVAVVTGAARSIGWATVQALVRSGAKSVLVDRDAAAPATANEALRQRSVEHLAEDIDITHEAKVDVVFAKVAARFRRIDVLVNNAGTAPRRPTVELSSADWQAVVDVNLSAGLFARPELLNRVLDVTPMHQLPEPEDIASAITYLASEQAHLITGHTLPVDGEFLAQ